MRAAISSRWRSRAKSTTSPRASASRLSTATRTARIRSATGRPRPLPSQRPGGRNNVRFYSPAMQAVVDERVKVETGLRRALADGGIRAVLQTQVEPTAACRSQSPVALAPRGTCPDLPGRIHSGRRRQRLIVPISAWVLEARMPQLAPGQDNPATRICASRSTSAPASSISRFHDSRSRPQLRTAARRSHRLKLELTENLLSKT